MLNEGDRLRSGVYDLDVLLDGLILGDNVVWVADGPDFGYVGEGVVGRVEQALLNESIRRRQPCFYVTAEPDIRPVRARLAPEVTVLDARPRGPHADPGVLETTIVEGSRGSPPGCVVVDCLGRLASRWGQQRAVGFFSRVCPKLFDLGALAYWRAPRGDLGRSSLTQITQVTQCVLEVSTQHLRVVKAEGRQAAIQGTVRRLELVDGVVRLQDELSLGRLARGLERLRAERHLTQTDLARIAGVTPSAISQAEAGRRGLALETLLLISDRMGVSLDDLVSAPSGPDYVLARRPRGGDWTERALLDDPHAGLRAHVVRLGPAESGTPELVHKGPELLLVASGLVQVTIGDDMPVMRAGDAALATRTAITAWRNLTSDPALLFWVLRD